MPVFTVPENAELHANSPEIVRRLHAHVRAPGAKTYSRLKNWRSIKARFFCGTCSTPSGHGRCARRGRASGVHVKRFSTQAMSLGSLSPEAHRTLALAMNQLGGPEQYRRRRRRSQYLPLRAGRSQQDQASRLGRFGVTADISSTPKNLKSRWRRARSPVRAANCPPRKSAIHRAHPARHARHPADFAAAASRHLQHRRPRAIDTRLARRQSARPHRRKTRFRFRSRHHCRGRSQGGRGRLSPSAGTTAVPVLRH